MNTFTFALITDVTKALLQFMRHSYTDSFFAGSKYAVDTTNTLSTGSTFFGGSTFDASALYIKWDAAAP